MRLLTRAVAPHLCAQSLTRAFDALTIKELESQETGVLKFTLVRSEPTVTKQDFTKYASDISGQLLSYLNEAMPPRFFVMLLQPP